MLSCLRDTYFSKLDYVGRKEVVLKEIETIINCELTLNNIKLYTPTTLIEKIRLLYKETKNDSFVDSLIKELFIALELIQGREIAVDRKNSDVVETFFKYTKYTVNRIGTYPLFTYDKDGCVKKIELARNNTKINILCSLIDTIENRQPEIKASLKKVL